MEIRTFFTWLALVTVATALVLIILYVFVPEIRPHGALAIGSVLLFVLICLGLFFMGRSAAGSRNKLAFNNVITLSVFGKMVASVGFLLAYQRLAKPANDWFVGIFLLTYVVYTVFEVWFMTKLAKN